MEPKLYKALFIRIQAKDTFVMCVWCIAAKEECCYLACQALNFGGPMVNVVPYAISATPE